MPPVSPELLERAAACYALEAGELTPRRGGHFAHVYGFQRQGRSYVLRLTPPDEDTDLPQMQAALHWLDYLASHGGLAAGPRPSAQGRLIESLEQPEGRYLAVAFAAAPGVLSEEFPLDRWDERLFASLGRSVGRMHALAQGYHPAAGLAARPQWNAGGSLFSRRPSAVLRQAQDASTDPALALACRKQEALLNEVEALPLEALPQAAESYGLIHADLHFGNFFIEPQSGRITIIDFDDCCYGWYVMDLAMLLFDVLVLYPGADRQEFAGRFLRSLLRGYREEKALERFWLAQMPRLLKLLELGVYIQVQPFYRPGDPDPWTSRFMPGRAERIAGDIPYLEFDFEALR